MRDTRTFFTADWHLGDDRQKTLGRPFENAEDMYQTILSNHNATVRPEDTVYMLGDVAHQAAVYEYHRLGEFNGHITLLRGNHDRQVLNEEFAPYVERIILEGTGIELDVAGIPCWLTHYPTQGRADRFNLVGHIHGAWRIQKNMLNVGVDVHHFRPITEEDVVFYFEAICDFYDEDCWIADNWINVSHKNRGKPGRYFEGSATTRVAEGTR